MKTLDQDPLDTLLDQSLQGASHSLNGEKFRIQLAGRIAAEQRRMKPLRLLPTGMGLLAAVAASLAVYPKVDFHTGYSTLAPFFEKLEPALAGFMPLLPSTPGYILFWIVSAGAALIPSLWLTNREAPIFRL